MSDTDLSDCVDELSADTLTRRRTSADQTVTGEGLVVPGATTDLRFQAQVTPATPKDLQRLPEGQRTSRAIRVITTTDLQVARSDPNSATSRRRGDLLVDEAGATFEVGSVSHWTTHGQFFDAVAAEVRR